MNNLKKARRECQLNLTQKQAAEALGISLSAYRSYEQGKVDIPSRHLQPMSELFGAPISYIVGTADDKVSAYEDRLKSDISELIAAYIQTDEQGRDMLLSFAKGVARQHPSNKVLDVIVNGGRDA